MHWLTSHAFNFGGLTSKNRWNNLMDIIHGEGHYSMNRIRSDTSRNLTFAHPDGYKEEQWASSADPRTYCWLCWVHTLSTLSRETPSRTLSRWWKLGRLDSLFWLVTWSGWSGEAPTMLLRSPSSTGTSQLQSSTPAKMETGQSYRQLLSRLFISKTCICCWGLHSAIEILSPTLCRCAICLTTRHSMQITWRYPLCWMRKQWCGAPLLLSMPPWMETSLVLFGWAAAGCS